MSSRRTRRAHLLEDLRLAIDCLPVHTRVAMLEGVQSNDIIVGAYVDRSGGVCPMLAAHRCGGRTDFLSFARSWDRFTGARGRARSATERELRILVAHLEASLLSESQVDLSRAIKDHHELMASRVDTEAAEPGRPAGVSEVLAGDLGDRDRQGELGHRRGWAWLRPFRRLDDYERALARVEAERDALAGVRSAPARAERAAEREREDELAPV